MSKPLIYVDDQNGQVNMLQTELRLAGLDSVYTLEAFVPPAQAKPVEPFMNAVARGPLNPDARYLLDIIMPVPNTLAKADVWPEGHAGEQDYCGIALARWLNLVHKVNPEQIALFTHLDRGRTREGILDKLFESTLVLTPGPIPSYFQKSTPYEVIQWLMKP